MFIMKIRNSKLGIVMYCIRYALTDMHLVSMTINHIFSESQDTAIRWWVVAQQAGGRQSINRMQQAADSLQ